MGFPDNPRAHSGAITDDCATAEPLCSGEDDQQDEAEQRMPLGICAWFGLFLSRRKPGQLASCLLIGVYAAWLNGFFSAWATTLPMMIRSPSSAGTESADVPHDGALLGFAAALANPIGGALIGAIADRFFVRRLRRLLLVCSLVALVAFAVLVGCRPPSPNGWLLTSSNSSATAGVGAAGGVLAILPSVLVGGAAIGATMPLAMELLAEVGYPLPPGASANAVVGLLQVTATVNTALVAVLTPAAMNVVMLLSVFFCVLLLLPVASFTGVAIAR